MSSAGQLLVAGRIPGERIATTVRTSASGTITTTETELDSVTASLVNGRTYRIRAVIPLQSSVAADVVRLRIRRTNTSGAQLSLSNRNAVTSGINYYETLEAEFTASSTADHVFISSMVRFSGTGNLTSSASSSQAAYIYVDYIRG